MTSKEKLKHLVEKVENLPQRNKKYEDYVWLTGTKVNIPLHDMTTNHVYHCLLRTKRDMKSKRENNMYAGHTQLEWVAAFQSESDYRHRLDEFHSNLKKINRLRKRNKK